MRSLAFAIRTLSILPIGNKPIEHEEHSLFWFPLVGAMYGGVAYLISRIDVFPAGVLATLIIAAWVLLSRAFHLDGLADFADGMGSGKEREGALAIMRDSHIGAFGTIALIVTFLVQYSALIHLTDDPVALVLAPLFGRAMIVIAASLLPYAREGEGSASNLVRGATRRHVLVLFFQLILIALFCWWRGGVKLVIRMVSSLLICSLSTTVVLQKAKKRLGGVTGDVLGATSVIAESVALLGFLLPLA